MPEQLSQELLDQAAIDALLNSVDDGAGDAKGPEIQIFSRFRRDKERVDIRDYDFKRPERISKDQMHALHTMHETFARNFGAAASGFLRQIVEIRVTKAEQITYQEYISSLPVPTSFNLVKAPPLSGPFCLEVSPLTVYPIIDRLLGGNGKELFIPQRPPTHIEQKLIQKLLHRAMQTLQEAWSSAAEIAFELGDMEANPQLVQIVPPNEVVVVMSFEVKFGNRAGTMSLCIPSNTIEPILDRLSAQSWSVTSARDDGVRWSERITKELTAARVTVDAVLAETTMTLRELRSLEPGDLILTGKPAAAPVILNVEGRQKFLASVGQSRGSRAIRILRPIGPEDYVTVVG
ncbi:MAG: flagellar motor switch protein FliM [Phycisphaerae bacterium]|nr:flagellar motor switch protein FliM [Phycisphaerae bacterium]